MAKKKKTPQKKTPKKRPVQKKRRAAATSKAVAVIKNQPQGGTVPVALSLANSTQVMEFGKTLKRYIDANGLSVDIEGKFYPLCGAWKFAGMNFGLTAIPHEPIAKHKSGEYVTVLYVEKEFKTRDWKTNGGKTYFKDVPIFCGFAHDVAILDSIRTRNKIAREITKPFYSYEVTVDIVRGSDQVRVGSGTSVCSNIESLKSGFDEYAVMGQAQTRTISRAFRNLLDYVLQSAGLEPTPGEEITEIQEQEKEFVHDKRRFDKNKITPNDENFKNILKQIMAGKMEVLEEARKHYTFTDDQERAISIAKESLTANK